MSDAGDGSPRPGAPGATGNPEGRMALLVGLTGGIASGKSTVAPLVASLLSMDWIDADGVARVGLPIPNDPALVGLPLHAQGLWLGQSCGVLGATSNLVSFEVLAN